MTEGVRGSSTRRSTESLGSLDPNDARSADAAARELAQRVFDRPLVLEAGAGTGKTSSLVSRIVAWCIGPGWQRSVLRRQAAPGVPVAESVQRDAIAADVLSRVAAITFTEAAAAEMAERTGETLAAVARGELMPGLCDAALPADRVERAARAAALLGALDHLLVRTVHAFCRGLLARYPLESRLHPNFQLDPDLRLQAEVVREVVEETVRAAYASDDSPLLQLALDGHGALEVEETLVALSADGVEPVSLRADPLAPERVERHLAELRSAISALQDCDGGSLAGVPERAKKTHAALQALELTEGLVAGFKVTGPDSLEALCEGLVDAWQGNALARLAEWSKGKFIAGETEALGESAAPFGDLAADLLPGLRALLDLSPRRLEASRRALLPMLEEVSRELRARGIATFASLLSGARDLLESRPDVCHRVRLELDQLLVDEFQDTDSLQCSIIRHLALSGPESQRPGLFLVGDPKQSIYGWRSADLAAYDGFVREVEEAGGEVHSLTVNFRSVPAILAEVERAIAPVMLRRPGLQPRFERLEAAQPLADDEGFHAGGRGPVEYWVSWGCEPGASEGEGASLAKAQLKSPAVTRIEAEALALDLLDLHESEGVPWRDMAVLFRGMGELDDYLAALRRCGVPYAVERDRNYYRRREVIDAAAWVRSVLDPNDHLALVTTLRSPAVGVPDAALIPLWSRGFPALASELYGAGSESGAELGEIVREVAGELADREGEIPGLDRVRHWETSLCAMLETLASLRESFDRDAADLFVERLRTQSLLEVSEAARYLGAFRVANLDRFFRELRVGLASSSDPQAILRRLRSDIARGRDEEEQRPVGEEEDAVPVMTIHKAKGLDFAHVYLVQLHKRSRPDTPPATLVTQWQGAFEYRFFSQSTLGFEAARAASRRVEAAERVRTLYVAMTRAKRRLVLMGNWSEAPAVVSPERAASHLELLAGRLSAAPGEAGDVDLVPLMSACAEAGEISRQLAGARWVFPGLADHAQGSQRRFAEEPVQLPAPGDVAREAAEIAELQRGAQARMQLRWGGPASHDAHVSLVDERSEVEEKRMLPRSRPGHLHGGVARADSMAAGVAIHGMLEDLNLTAEPEPELARQRALLPGRIVSALELRPGSLAEAGSASAPAQRSAALERALALLNRFASGALARRLWEIAPNIVARELEVWLPGSHGEEGPDTTAAPLRYVAGTIDLLYRDPADGEWVVVDYKSDRVASREEVDSRSGVYASQGAAYTRAVQEALGLDSRPRFELWFLEADLVSPSLFSD